MDANRPPPSARLRRDLRRSFPDAQCGAAHTTKSFCTHPLGYNPPPAYISYLHTRPRSHRRSSPPSTLQRSYPPAHTTHDPPAHPPLSNTHTLQPTPHTTLQPTLHSPAQISSIIHPLPHTSPRQRLASLRDCRYPLWQGARARITGTPATFSPLFTILSTRHSSGSCTASLTAALPLSTASAAPWGLPKA